MNESPPLIDRFLLGVDIESYSTRTAHQQFDLQIDLKKALDDAALLAGLDRPSWQISVAGDGEVSVLPDGDLLAVTGPFVRELDRILERHNEKCAEAARLRIRLAMHKDVLRESPLGTAGPAHIELARLLNAELLREALDKAPAACLALLLSESVYQKAIVTDFGELRVRDFTRVQVKVKTYDKPAYLYVPRHDPRLFASVGEPPAEEPGRSVRTGPDGSGGGGMNTTNTTNFTTNARSVGFVGTFGDHASIQIRQEPETDPFADGRAALDEGEYGAAVTFFEKAAADPAHRVEAHFLLAVALLDGRRPGRHGPRVVKRVERELRQALSAAPDHTGALLLSAIVKQDHYEAGGFDSPLPGPQDLWAAADPASHPEQVAVLIKHVEAYDSAIWRLLREERS